MDPGGISVERTLPIDGALLGDVLLRLRRDSRASTLHWTLGALGAAEVEVGFTSDGPDWITRVRLWNYSGLALTTATLRLTVSAADEVRLALVPVHVPELAPDEDAAALGALARAATDELAEELLWHATRAGLTARG
jgi:hypothetical protein